MDLIMTTASGKEYVKIYEKLFKESHLRFSKKLGRDYFILDHFIERSPNHSHISWQKLLMFRLPEVSKYRRVLFIDADVYVTRHANDPFKVVGDKLWGMADNNPYDIPQLTKSDPELYKSCPDGEKPLRMLNAGIFVIDKALSGMMERIFYSYKEQPCYDNGPFSYHLLTGPEGVVLPPEFNTFARFYRIAYGKGLSTILRMYREASFIHFAGGIMKSIAAVHIIRYIDIHPDSLLTRIIFFLGKEKFDFLTAPILRLLQKAMAFYSYRAGKVRSLFKKSDA